MATTTARRGCIRRDNAMECDACGRTQTYGGSTGRTMRAACVEVCRACAAAGCVTTAHPEAFIPFSGEATEATGEAAASPVASVTAEEVARRVAAAREAGTLPRCGCCGGEPHNAIAVALAVATEGEVLDCFEWRSRPAFPAPGDDGRGDYGDRLAAARREAAASPALSR